jgi:hypothetical protein
MVFTDTVQDGEFKGTGTRAWNSVSVVWFDRPWLGESSTDIHNFCAGSLILY